MKNKEVNLKIMLFTAGFPPPFVGGSVEYVFNIVSNMPPRTMVIHTSDACSLEAKILDKTLPQRIIRSSFINHVQRGILGKRKKILFQKLESITEYILWPFFAFSLIIRERPDVIQIGEHNFAAIAALFARWTLGIPYLYIAYAEEITMLSKRPLHNRLFLTLIRNSSTIITVSDYTRNLLLNSGISSSQIITILPSVSSRKNHEVDAELELNLRTKYNLGDSKVILTVGSLEERKGHSSVIIALQEISRFFPSIKYIVVGSGPEEKALKLKADELGLKEQVIFTGGINDQELNCLYEICDLFVMPHRQLQNSLNTEGCPTVFLEASAHGKAVIGGNAGGVSDAIINEVTGYIIDGTDEVELSNRVIELLSNNDLAVKMGLAGKSYAASLTPEANTKKVLKIYQNIVNKK